MRVFAIIFSIYLLALSLMPCSDAYNACQSERADALSVESHNHKADHNDFCSPFCTCSCCGTSVDPKITPFYITVAKLGKVSHIKCAIRDFTFVSNYNGSIWQPPKTIA